MTMNQIQAMIDRAVAKALGAQATVNAQATKQITKQIKTTKPTASAPVLTNRHKAIIAAFKRKGIKDPQLFTDIKPFKGWMAVGRIVRKGQKSVNGLFHVSQTDPIKN